MGHCAHDFSGTAGTRQQPGRQACLFCNLCIPLSGADIRHKGQAHARPVHGKLPCELLNHIAAGHHQLMCSLYQIRPVLNQPPQGRKAEGAVGNAVCGQSADPLLTDILLQPFHLGTASLVVEADGIAHRLPLPVRQKHCVGAAGPHRRNPVFIYVLALKYGLQVAAHRVPPPGRVLFGPSGPGMDHRIFPVSRSHPFSVKIIYRTFCSGGAHVYSQ